MSAAAAEPGALERDELPLPIAFAASLLLSVLLALSIILVARHRPALPKPVMMRVAMVQLPTPPAPPLVALPPDALAPPPPPLILPSRPAGTFVPPSPPPRPEHAVRRPAHAHMMSHLARQVPPSPFPGQAARQEPPAPTPAARPAASDPAMRDSLKSRIAQAIRQATRFPEAAREMGTHGAALVGFLYRDRTAFSVQILQSSRSSILDQAALEIVRHADLPPPGTLAGQTINLEMSIVFDLKSDDD